MDNLYPAQFCYQNVLIQPPIVKKSKHWQL